MARQLRRVDAVHIEDTVVLGAIAGGDVDEPGRRRGRGRVAAGGRRWSARRQPRPKLKWKRSTSSGNTATPSAARRERTRRARLRRARGWGRRR